MATLANGPRVLSSGGACLDFPKMRGTKSMQEIGNYDYVIEQGAKNLRAAAKYATDVNDDFKASIKELIQVKEAINMSKIRTATLLIQKEVAPAQRIALMETETMLTDKVNHIDQTLIHLLEAQACLKMCAYIQPMLPSTREYLKDQLDECSLLVCPEWSAEDPSTWKYYGWIENDNNLPWDPQDPETWKNYGWQDNNLPWDPEDSETWKNYGWRDFSLLPPMDENDPSTWEAYGWQNNDELKMTQPKPFEPTEDKFLVQISEKTLEPIEEHTENSPTDSPSLEDFFPPRNKTGNWKVAASSSDE